MMRLVNKAEICEYLGRITPSTYDNWQAKGIVPGPVRGTNRYDVRAHDLALDRASGLDKSIPAMRMSALDQWENSYAL